MSLPLVLRSISRSYRAGIPGCCGVATALRDCSLEVRAGETVGILGRAGSGKSTLLLCAAGLLRPDSGSITWFGDPSPPSPHDVVFVPEHASHHRFLTVRETLEHAALRDAPTARCRDPVGGALEGAGLLRHADTRVGLLSSGAAIRLAIARALLRRPRLLLLDETLSLLARRERREVEEVLAAVRDGSRSVVISSGDILALAPICDRIVRLEAGEIRDDAADRALSGAASCRGLEIETSPRAAALLRARLGGVPLGERCVRVPLGERSCEETLALCRAMGITVFRSRVSGGLEQSAAQASAR